MFSKILVQHEDSAGLLKSIGVSSKVSRDTRFDRVLQVSEAKKTFAWVEQFRDHQNVLIAGSTWPKDEEIILSFIHSREGEGYKYIIVPHDIIPDRLDALERNIRVPVVRFSQCKEVDPAAVKVLIVDSIGHLSGLYAYGDVAYVGGGFNAGVHNVLEAAVYGIPVLFGPRYYKSLEAAELLNEKGAFCVSNAEEMKRGIDFISSKGKAGFQANRTYVVERAGGTQRVMEELEKLIRK